MTTYLVFYYGQYEASGGMNDCYGLKHTLKEAQTVDPPVHLDIGEIWQLVGDSYRCVDERKLERIHVRDDISPETQAKKPVYEWRWSDWQEVEDVPNERPVPYSSDIQKKI